MFFEQAKDQAEREWKANNKDAMVNKVLPGFPLRPLTGRGRRPQPAARRVARLRFEAVR